MSTRKRMKYILDTNIQTFYCMVLSISLLLCLALTVLRAGVRICCGAGCAKRNVLSNVDRVRLCVCACLRVYSMLKGDLHLSVAHTHTHKHTCKETLYCFFLCLLFSLWTLYLHDACKGCHT